MTKKQNLNQSIDCNLVDLGPHQFATRYTLIRQALANHRTWIEAQLGISLEEAIVFDGLTNLSQIGVDKLLAVSDRKSKCGPEHRRLLTLVAQANIPPEYPPIVDVVRNVRTRFHTENLKDEHNRFGIEWMDCPVALRLHYYDCTVIVMNLPFHDGPGSQGEHTARLLLARRDCASKVMELLEMLYRRDPSPRLRTLHDKERRISNVDWDDLVLEASVITLLKNDFETFWESAAWYRERKLPFRRGYLLHGPPGNGKTSAIRAMMSSRKINAHTMRFFDPRAEDSDLDDLFDNAYRDRPAMVLFEDIDRAFPKTGDSCSKISLQHLLNCLDGVATGEGIVVVATANEPTLLDPAILRRPGRFDRVVEFPNPSRELCLEYFCRMNSTFASEQLQQAVDAASGLSFAQLRETYVIAGQLAFKRGSDVTDTDLLTGIRSLRQRMINSSRQRNSAGFGPATESIS